MYQKTILPVVLEQAVNQLQGWDFPGAFNRGCGPALIDRLTAYAAREIESKDPEETKRQQGDAAERSAEKVRLVRESVNHAYHEPEKVDGEDAWRSAVAEAKRKWARPDSLIQDITALLVSFTNLSLSRKTRIHGSDPGDKINEFADSRSPRRFGLVAPIKSYQSVLAFLAILRHVPLLSQQLFSTLRSIAHSAVSDVLQNNTTIESPGGVDKVLDLCHLLQTVARKHFEAGGERMRYTFPAFITSSIQLYRLYKNHEHMTTSACWNVCRNLSVAPTLQQSATEEIDTVQLYCDTLEQYLYYFDRKAPASPSWSTITSSIDTTTSPASSSSYLHPSQRIEVVEAISMRAS
ncbi:hypothetical protein BS17DRAFT_810133 [Gyrodon lividus]|nr:hypothetical protein BS17DRAFT_810133 [Gyrodon lividus]